MPVSSWKTVGVLSSVGLALVLALVIGTAAGHYVDRWLGTSPWGFFLGFLCGLVAGVLNVYRMISAALKEP